MLNKKFLISTLAVLAILSFSGIATFADTNPVLPVIRIVVFAPNNSPIQGANVYVSFEDNVNVEYQLGHTNAEGRASFNIANATMYQFVINGTGYATITGNYEFTLVNGNSTVNEYVTSNACHTDYTVKGSTPPLQENYTVTLKQTSCA